MSDVAVQLIAAVQAKAGTQTRVYITYYSGYADRLFVDILDPANNYQPVTTDPFTATEVTTEPGLYYFDVTIPSTPGKYVIKVWYGTYTNGVRNVLRVLLYRTLLVVSKSVGEVVSDIDDRVAVYWV